MKNNINWILKELPRLVKKEIISATVADNLAEYYRAQVKETKNNKLLSAIITILGAVLIGLGIILMFAHNWTYLSKSVRAFLALFILFVPQVMGVWVLLKRNTSIAWRESVAVIIALMVGASIALLAQTYHVFGDYRSFLLVWFLLTCSLTYIFNSLFAASFSFGLAVYAYSHWQTFDNLKSLLVWLLLAIILPQFFKYIKEDKDGWGTSIFATVIAVGLLFPLSGLLEFLNISNVFGYAFMYVVYLFVAVSAPVVYSGRWQKPFYWIGDIFLLGLLFNYTFKSSWSGVAGFAWPHTWADACASLILVAIFTLLGWFNFSLYRQKQYAVLPYSFVALLLCCNGFFASSGGVPLLFANLYFMAIAMHKVFLGVAQNRLGQINYGLALLMILIIFRFFDDGMSFYLRGIVFILVGLSFIGLNLRQLKQKRK